MSDNETVTFFGELGAVVKWGFFIFCGLFLFNWLIGHYGRFDSTLPHESFEVRALPERLLGQTDNYAKLKYIGEGELRDVELTVKVSVPCDQYEFKRYKDIWNTNEELQIIIPVALPIDQVSMSGSAYCNGEFVKIVHWGPLRFAAIRPPRLSNGWSRNPAEDARSFSP